jgi:Secretion system C-terminal sorting domain
MSADGGHTWTYYLGTFPNNGSATITLPNPDSTISAARIKVKGTNNVFFNVNSIDFSVVQNVDVKIFPIPADNIIHITTGANSQVDIVIYNTIGQKVWSGKVFDQLDIPVSSWSRGIYLLRSTDIENKHAVNKFVLK